MEIKLKDTGSRTTLETGSQKEIVEGRGRYDLLPLGTIGELIYEYWLDPSVDKAQAEYSNKINRILINLELSLTEKNIETKRYHILEAVNIFIYHFLETTPLKVVPQLAKLYEAGANKYSARDWEKGRYQEIFINSALRHLFQCLNGETDEDHATAFMWNLISCHHILGVMPEMAYTIGLTVRNK